MGWDGKDQDGCIAMSWPDAAVAGQSPVDNLNFWSMMFHTGCVGSLVLILELLDIDVGGWVDGWMDG